MKVLDRINSLRTLMRESNVDACIINGSDPHLSEYVPARWKTREWISGFSGSYGRVVVTSEKAALWTDSRYFIQAETELKDSGIILMKDRQPDTIPYEEWILSELPENSQVIIDGSTISVSEEKKLKEKFNAKALLLIKNRDLVNEIWDTRPGIPEEPAYDYPVQFTGISRTEKISLIRKKLKEKNASGTIVSMLDDLAWTFNIRGNDIDFTPLTTGYAFIDQERAIIFIKEKKVPETLRTLFKTEKIEILNYDFIFTFLKENKTSPLLIDPDRVNSLIRDSINQDINLIEGPSIPMILKSTKNQNEIAGMKEAHRKDGVAMINFLYWIYSSVGKEEISELTVCRKLKEFRLQEKNFIEESFYPIAGYAEHGAIIHYHVKDETDFKIKPEGLLLIDSGGQYLEGTTDITRTISLGEVTDQQKFDFTLVLKGMIQLTKAVFLDQCKGYSLDILARKALWENNLDYGHGTGHGVGHFLCVHEGPVSIRQDYNPYTLNEGNILSNEPGVYKKGEYGIRIENLLLCKKDNKSDFGNFLSFETLTLCPIDKRLIALDLLNKEEVNWINNYHSRILNELGGYLKYPVLRWLEIQCSAV